MLTWLITLWQIMLIQANPEMLWPRPQTYQLGSQTAVLAKQLQFQTNQSNNKILQLGVNRYIKRIQAQRWIPVVPNFLGELTNNTSSQGLKLVNIQIESDGLSLDENTDESYELEVVLGDTPTISVTSKTVFGALHGLESLVQMIQYDVNTEQNFLSKVPFKVTDKPQFPHRGLLLDTSRNFYPIEDIKRTIDALSMNKMNVLHWHIVDSHSWPFKSQKHPLLWQKGAVILNEVYSFNDIRDLIEFGLERGVRVIPELEAPAHSYAIGKAYPELATCMNLDSWDKYAAEPPSGQIDPTNPKSIEVVKDIMDEFIKVFSDSVIHLSGDEVNLECWKTSTKINDYLKSQGVSIDSLLPDFAQKMHEHAAKNNKRVMVWQEIVLNHNVTLPANSLVQVWTGTNKTQEIIQRGYDVIASSSDYWYLDCGRGQWMGNAPNGNSWCDPFKSWQRIYSYDLLTNLTTTQQPKVKGGEVAIWSEAVDAVNLDVIAWPRTSAAAEVLWSGNRYDNGTLLPTNLAQSRLNNFRYYLVANKIRADATQPMWCIKNPGRCDLSTAAANIKKSHAIYLVPSYPTLGLLSVIFLSCLYI